MSMYNNNNMSLPDITSVKSSFSNITHLSDDLLSEVFSRLPFRSTARCKCVSKRWLDLMSSPSFVRLFLSHQHNAFHAVLIFLSPHHLMLAFPPSPADHELYPSPSMRPKEFETNTLSSPEVFVKGNVCGCSENVLLCSDNRYTSGHGYFLCDPLTKRTIQVPSLETRKECLYAVGLVCDPFHTTDEEKQNWTALEPDRCFRVVLIRSFIIRHFEFEVDVWSSETGEWKQNLVRCTRGFAFAPHWSLSFAYEGKLYFMGRTGIFVYDPYGYKGETLDYPYGSDPMNIMSFGFLGSTCGRLRIADIGHSDVRIWELVDIEHWELVHHVNFSAYLPPEFCNNYYKKVGGFHPHDGDIVYLYSYADGIFVANLQTRKFTAIPGYDKSDLSPFHLEVPLFPSSPEE